MRNKLLISLLLTASSSTVFAMPYDPINHPALLEIALTGGGFVAGEQDMGYGIQLDAISASGKPTGSIVNADPSYRFGGEILLGYYFGDSSINVDGSYFGTHHTIDDSATGAITTSLVPPDFVGGSQIATDATSDYHFRYDFANLELGSLTRVGLNGLIINPQLGLSYAHVQSSQSVTYAGGDVPAGSFVSAYQSATFNGVGPSFNIDLNYVICQPITLLGNFRYSGLIGKVDSNYSALASGVINDNVAVELTSRRSVVSLIQTELAVAYDFNWADAFCGNIALGYQVTQFFGTGQKFGFTDDVSDAQFSNSALDSNVHGWFLRLTMDFAV